MKSIVFVLAFLFSAMVIAGAASAAMVPVTVDEVKVDGTTMDKTATTRLDLVRGESIPVRIEITAQKDAKDVQIEAFISGYEYSDKNPVSDSTHVFDVEENVTYVKKLTVSLPDNAEEDDYRLRVIVTDRNDEEIINNYRIKIDVQRHNIAIKDVVFSPEGSVEAGRVLLATVRVKNMGEQKEEGLKVKVSIPDLGVSASDYIDQLDADESTTSEELYMRLPTCAKAGEYDAIVTVTYDENYEIVTKKMNIEVAEGETCAAAAAKPVPPKTVISLSTTTQSIAQGQSGAAYPITITNSGNAPRSYTVAVDGITGWAKADITPSNTVVVGAGESATVYVQLSADAKAAPGEHLFVAKIKSGEETLKELSLKANVTAAPSGWASAKKALEIALVALVVLLVILGLIFGFSKLKGDNEGNEPGQTYY